MSHSIHRRPSSPRPGGKRIVADPVRASTGTVALNPSYDPSAASRLGYSNNTNSNGYSSDIGHGHGKGYALRPSPAVESRLEVQPISSQTYRDPSQSTRTKTEYAVRSRPRSSTTSTFSPGSYWDRSRNNTTTAATSVPSSSSRLPPVVRSGYSASPTSYPLRLSHATQEKQNPERALLSASSPHNGGGRHRLRDYSTDYASDPGRLHVGRRSFSKRTRDHRGVVYPGHGSRRRWRYLDPEGSKRKGVDGIDAYDAYSYMTPNEKFEGESNDYVAKLHHRRGGYGKERPLSMAKAEDYYRQSFPEMESRVLGLPGSYYGGGGSHHVPPRYHVPIALHQGLDDGHYSRPGEYQHGHDHRHHDDRDDAGGVRLGSAVLGNVHSDDTSYGLPARYSRARPPRDSEREYGRQDSQRTRDRVMGTMDPSSSRRDHHRSQVRRSTELGGGSDGGSSYTFVGPRNHRRHHSRGGPRRNGGLKNSSSSSSSSSGDDNRPLPPTRVKTPDPRKFVRSRSRRRVDGYFSGEEDDGDDDDDDQSMSDEFHRQRRPIMVDPASVKELEAATPKGILKAPTDKFPEEPNPVREGVAPLKDAHRKGIPPGARWTKINRKLVNPAALEAGHERFEERSEFVIVLRVLTKEEIQRYAEKTKEIRDIRYHEYIQDKRRRMEAARRHGFSMDDFSSDDEEEEEDYGRKKNRANPLAIEGLPELDQLNMGPRVKGPNEKANANPLMVEPTRTS